MVVINEYLRLRKRIHRNKFRFDITPALWRFQFEDELRTNHVVTVVKENMLKGYAIYSFLTQYSTKICKISEICADERVTLSELIDNIVKNCLKEKACFILFRSSGEPYTDIFDKKGFITVLETVIMGVLLNPQDILTTLSEEIQDGIVLELVIQGFEPIALRVGQTGMMIEREKKPDLTVSTDRKTFLRLFFDKTSVWKEFLKGNLGVNKIYRLPTVSRFFKIVRHKKWYMPPGDLR